MSSHEEGSPRGESPLIEKVLERFAEPTDTRSRLMADFAQSYLQRLNPDRDLSPDSLYHEVLSLFEFIEVRTSPIAVRAFNPTERGHGYEPGTTVIEVHVDDSPFLVDSITNELEAHLLAVAAAQHPVLGTERDEDGRLTAMRPARASDVRESVQHYVLERKLFDADLPGLEKALRRVLLDVQRVVRDFDDMVDVIDRMIDLVETSGAHYPDPEVDEAIDFLKWLREDNFVFLGYREYELAGSSQGTTITALGETGLGILTTETPSTHSEPTPLSAVPDPVATRYREGDLLIVSKTNRLATVHRRARMDYIGVRIVGAGGETKGEARLLGLFTSKAYMERASRTPVLREKLEHIADAEDLIEGSDRKSVV